MVAKTTGSKAPDILGSGAALRRALQKGLETGTPLWHLKDGRMVDLTRDKRRKVRGR
ncbi:MAG TPA: hypothetical protein VNA25_11055 [Phycisphaerae bacterium]|nr:hypothetical protein [Phycisphaerae bacterium]